ncbi:MAG: ABC transporter ATP-binding protein [Flavobacteriales bacterium]|nr:ABC transporter ATP-binding protein [Flavobacteriales bacterium]
MASTVGKAFDSQIFWRLMSYAKPYKLRFWGTLSLTLFLAAIGPLKPYLIIHIVNDLIGQNDLVGLRNWSLLYVGIIVIESFATFLQTYSANWLGQKIINDIRVKLYKHIVQFKLKYFDTTPIGRLVTRCVSDIETIAEVFSSGILVIIGDILKLVVIILIMFLVNWKFALVVLIPVPILIFATRIFKNAIKSAFQSVRLEVSRLNTFVQEHITGMNVIQIFNREKAEEEKFWEINKRHRAAHIKSVWAYSVFFPVVELLSASSVALLIFWGVNAVQDPDVLNADIFGQIVGFVMFIFMMYRPIRQLADRFNVLQMGMVGSERVFEVLDTEASIDNVPVEAKSDIQGNIKFENVWFAYKDENYVLKDLSFELKTGETVAFVGATGAGKSSVINLLSRFYEFQKGKILIEGKDVRTYNKDFLRKNISVVLQDVFLFSDSILNNITLNDPDISFDQVEAAAKEVGAHDFIMKCPGGYNYDVKERGTMLSVGQRQLISFIRAYVHDPKILVLDEATSSVDTESEILIQNAIETLTENRTSIVIAHRLSTIKRADKIIVLEHGKIIEHGSHAELINSDGHYKKLYDLQFKH